MNLSGKDLIGIDEDKVCTNDVARVFKRFKFFICKNTQKSEKLQLEGRVSQ